MGSLDGIAVAYSALKAVPYDGWDIRLMLAISGAESSWTHNATNHNTNGSTDYGLWQINNKAWPQLFTEYTWYEPSGNAYMAWKVFTTQGIRAWVTNNTGAYTRYLPTVDKFLATKPEPAPPPSAPAGGPVQSYQGLTDSSQSVSAAGSRFALHAQRMTAYSNTLKSL